MADDKKLEARKVKRMRYTDGLFLRQEEFNLEQNYHIRMRQLHNRYLHSAGIVYGLEVSYNVQEGGVYVSHGMALMAAINQERDEDICQEIILTEDTKVELPATLLNGREENIVYLYLNCNVERKDIIDDRGGKEEIHWWERAMINPLLVTDSTQILLAKLTIKKVSGGSVIPTDIDISGRTYAGVSGALNIPVNGHDAGLSIIGKKFGEQNGLQVRTPIIELDGDVIAKGKVSFQQTDQVVKPTITGNSANNLNALQIDADTVNINGDCNISGNLNVSGGQTIINTTELEIEDNIIRVNKNVKAKKLPDTSGIEVFRGDKQDTAKLIWSESQKQWKIGLGDPTNLFDVAYGANWLSLTQHQVVDLHRHTLLANSDGITALSVVKNGYIGIGTDAPTANLDVNGKINSSEINAKNLNSGQVNADDLIVKNSVKSIIVATGTVHTGDVQTTNLTVLDEARLESLFAKTISEVRTVKTDTLEAGIVTAKDFQCNSLTVSGAAKVTSLTANGTITATSFQGDGSLLTGISSSQWLSVSGGISYDKGNVGIGVNPPSEKLHINGNIKTTGNVFATKFIGDGSQLTGIETGQWENENDGISYNKGNVKLRSEKLNSKLVINTDFGGRIYDYTKIPAGIMIGNEKGSSTALWQGLDADHNLEVAWIQDNKRFMEYGRINANRCPLVLQDNPANVGIGIVEPAEKLHVEGNIRATGTIIGDTFVGDGSKLTGINGPWAEVKGGTAFMGNVAIGDHLLGPDNQLITYYQNVGIGSTSPLAKMEIRTSGNHLLLNRDNTETTGGKLPFLTLNQVDPYGKLPDVYPSILFQHQNKYSYRIESRNNGVYFKTGDLNSDVGATVYALSFLTGSSKRWKENISSMQDVLSKIDSLNPVFFEWNQEHGGKHDLGFIAEEVGQIIPEVVIWEDDGKQAYAIDYSKLSAVAIAGIKELSKIVDDLKAQNKKLETKVTSLEKKLKAEK